MNLFTHTHTRCYIDNLMWKKGCYVHGLFLEGARWSLKNRCLEKSLPKVLVEPLPILSIQPIEAHRLKLQVSSIDKDAKSDKVEIDRESCWSMETSPRKCRVEIMHHFSSLRFGDNMCGRSFFRMKHKFVLERKYLPRSKVWERRGDRWKCCYHIFLDRRRSDGEESASIYS